MARQWELAGRARHEFADLVEPFNERQLETLTLCEGWTVRHVLGHLVWFSELNMPSYLFRAALPGFKFKKLANRAVEKRLRRPVPDLIEALRSDAEAPLPVPGAPETRMVTELAIHTQDVRRALDLPGELHPEVVLMVLVFMTRHRSAKHVLHPKAIDELTLSTTDGNWSVGSGPEVKGPPEALMMALAGRPTFHELTGDGVGILKAQLRLSKTKSKEYS
jgi:uncharacterized protein (TIGR03083 family)